MIAALADAAARDFIADIDDVAAFAGASLVVVAIVAVGGRRVGASEPVLCCSNCNP